MVRPSVHSFTEQLLILAHSSGILTPSGDRRDAEVAGVSVAMTPPSQTHVGSSRRHRDVRPRQIGIVVLSRRRRSPVRWWAAGVRCFTARRPIASRARLSIVRRAATSVETEHFHHPA